MLGNRIELEAMLRPIGYLTASATRNKLMNLSAVLSFTVESKPSDISIAINPKFHVSHMDMYGCIIHPLLSGH